MTARSPSPVRSPGSLSAVAWCLSAACAGLLAAADASAQAFPAKAVRLVVPYGASSTPDILSRLVGPRLTEAWGQQVVVENVVGANGIVGTELVVRSAKDGHTLAMIAANHAVTPALYAKVPFDPVRDVTPITAAVSVSFVLLVHPSLPATDIKSLLALARVRPGQLTFASAGNGSPGHLAGQLLKSMAGIDLTHVPYKAIAQGLVDTIGGHVSMSMSPTAAGMPHARSGKLRALGVTSARRSTAAPDVPTIAESGVPGYALTAWVGLVGPAGLPAEVVQRIGGDLVRTLQVQDVRDKLAAQGVDLIGSTPAEFAALLATDVAKWGKLARDAGAKLD